MFDVYGDAMMIVISCLLRTGGQRETVIDFVCLQTVRHYTQAEIHRLRLTLAYDFSEFTH